MKLILHLCLILALTLAQKFQKNQGNILTNMLWPNEEYLLKVWITKNEETIMAKDYELRYSLT